MPGPCCVRGTWPAYLLEPGAQRCCEYFFSTLSRDVEGVHPALVDATPAAQSVASAVADILSAAVQVVPAPAAVEAVGAKAADQFVPASQPEGPSLPWPR